MLKKIIIYNIYRGLCLLASLKEPLEKYITRWNGLVKLYRTGKRVGLIEARTLGAQKSIGDAIVILDAHCECVSLKWRKEMYGLSI